MYDPLTPFMVHLMGMLSEGCCEYTYTSDHVNRLLPVNYRLKKGENPKRLEAASYSSRFVL